MVLLNDFEWEAMLNYRGEETFCGEFGRQGAANDTNDILEYLKLFSIMNFVTYSK
jgi:hypothetical protein